MLCYVHTIHSLANGRPVGSPISLQAWRAICTPGLLTFTPLPDWRASRTPVRRLGTVNSPGVRSSTPVLGWHERPHANFWLACPWRRCAPGACNYHAPSTLGSRSRNNQTQTHSATSTLNHGSESTRRLSTLPNLQTELQRGQEQLQREHAEEAKKGQHIYCLSTKLGVSLLIF